MKRSQIGILAFVMVLVVAIGPASAFAQVWDVNSDMDSQEIQGIIDIANAGDTINFTTEIDDIYPGISLTINKPLNLIGNGVTLVGTGSSNVLTISGTTGVNITNFDINVNGLRNGITGSNVISAIIANNTIRNGGDGINIFMMYKDLTIENNTITNMSTSFGDGISLVNHDLNVETTTTSRIRNNIIDDVDFGIFLGGNFNGTISGNSINDVSIAGMNITGKHNATLGSLNADIIFNNITNAADIGIAMETPNLVYLNLTNNNVYSDGKSLLKGVYYRIFDISNLHTTPNYFNNTVDDLTTNGTYW